MNILRIYKGGRKYKKTKKLKAVFEKNVILSRISKKL